MKFTPSVPQAAVLALALGTASMSATFAQTTPAPTTPPSTISGSGGSARPGALTDDEKAQLQKAHDAAEAADPTLKTDEDVLTQARTALRGQGANASADDKAALRTKYTDFQKKLRAAELKIDPTLQPIFDKQDAARAAMMKNRGGN